MGDTTFLSDVKYTLSVCNVCIRVFNVSLGLLVSYPLHIVHLKPYKYGYTYSGDNS